MASWDSTAIIQNVAMAFGRHWLAGYKDEIRIVV